MKEENHFIYSIDKCIRERERERERDINQPIREKKVLCSQYFPNKSYVVSCY